jgi:hypothetical protein
MSSTTVILNGYRRPANLALQVESIKKQTVPPDQIWLWINYHEDFDEGTIDLTSLGIDRICKNDYNWKYFGRFALSMLAQTDFVALFDDDTIPGEEWLENCLRTYEETPGILGGVGLRLASKEYYMDHERFGWPSHNEDTTEVDLVGHAWFINKDHLKYIWMEKPYTWDTGEDIHLSAMAQKYGNLKTYVPPHPPLETSKSSSLYGYELGVDEKTHSVINQQEFFSLRDRCIQHYTNNGWSLVLDRENNEI